MWFGVHSAAAKDLPALNQVAMQATKAKPQLHEILAQFGWNPAASCFRRTLANTSVVLQAILDMPEDAPMETVKSARAKPPAPSPVVPNEAAFAASAALQRTVNTTPSGSLKQAADMFAQLLSKGTINSTGGCSLHMLLITLPSGL
jgi:hypothetical protein